MPTELILIRHGESQYHLKGLTGGWTDTPLTNKRERQAECAARRLSALCPASNAELISSDLIRAKQTANTIAQQLKSVVPTFHPELRELGNGLAKDKTREEAKKLVSLLPSRSMT